MTGQVPGGWYSDPTSTHEFRYWDGERWTVHVSDKGVQSRAPLGQPPVRRKDGSRAGARVRVDGVYQNALADYSHFLRFGADGQAWGLSSAGSVEKVARRLGVDPDCARAESVKVDPAAGRIEFTLVSPLGAVDYRGTFVAEGLVLDVFSHINGNEAPGERYRFVPVADLPARRSAQPGSRP